MAKKHDIIAAARRLAKVPIYEVAGISKKIQADYVKQSVGYILGDISKNDSTLYNAMEKTFTEASTELNQLNPVMRRWMQQEGKDGSKSFGCFWDTSTPFIVYQGKVYSLGGGTLAADFKTAMTQYTAYLIGNTVSDSGRTTVLHTKRSGKPAANLAASNVTITAIKSGN